MDYTETKIKERIREGMVSALHELTRVKQFGNPYRALELEETLAHVLNEYSTKVYEDIKEFIK